MRSLKGGSRNGYGVMGAIIAKVLFEILVSGIIRWIVRRIHIDGPYDRVLRWLEGKKSRPPADALTQKEILSLQIIKAVDSTVVSEDIRQRIIREFAHCGLVRRKWDQDLSRPLKFEWKKFFVQSRSTLAEHVVPKINPLYDSAGITCFAILPFPRRRKNTPTESFENAFENCLGSQSMRREFITSGMLDRKMGAEWLGQLKEGERILVIQPMAANDDYLERTLDYIKKCSMGTVHEVITLVDGSGRSTSRRSQNPPERVLVELDLSHAIDNGQ